MRRLALAVPRAAVSRDLALFFALVAGVASAERAAGQSAGAYTLGPGDRIRIQVAEVAELNVDLDVDEDGSLSLPVLGVVPVRGLSEERVADDLRRRLETAGVRRATVAVRLLAARSRPVTLVGAFVRPGTHPLPVGSTLLEVIFAAGGLAAGHGPTIVVRRRAENGLSDELEVAVADLLERGDPAVNLPLVAGDVVSVPPAKAITIHFLGEVAGPGTVTFAIGDRVTLLRAVARVGGLKETASKRIRILREDEEGKRQEIVADFRAILAGRDADVELLDGDVVLVKESFF